MPSASPSRVSYRPSATAGPASRGADRQGGVIVVRHDDAGLAEPCQPFGKSLVAVGRRAHHYARQVDCGGIQKPVHSMSQCVPVAGRRGVCNRRQL